MNIPSNEEHVEARQADVNAKRQAMKEAMSPEDRARLEVIEECVRKLEEAKIPFTLYASSDSKTTPEGFPEGWRGWFQFNKMAYAPSFEEYREQALNACRSLLTPLMTHQSYWLPGHIVVHDHGGPVYLFRDGKRFDLRSPEPQES